MTGKSLINRVAVITGGNPTKMKRAWDSLNAVQRGTARPKLEAIARNPPANNAARILAQEQVMQVLGRGR